MADMQNPIQRDDDLDLNALLGTITDRRWLVIVVTGMFFLMSVAYAFLATPVYEADAIVQVEQKVPDLPGLSAVTQTLGASSSEATTEIALITSRSVIGSAADNLHLAIQVRPWRFPMIGSLVARRFSHVSPGAVAPPKYGLSRYDWGGASIDISQFDVPDGMLGQNFTLVSGRDGSYTLFDDDAKQTLSGLVGQRASGGGVTILVKKVVANLGTRFDVTRKSQLAVINQLRQMLVASEDGKDSGIITLTYDDPDPKLATQLLDQISELYVKQNVGRNSAEAASSLKFVQEQLPKVRHDLGMATAALNIYQTGAHSVDISLQTKGLLDQEVTIEASIQQLHMQQVDLESQFTARHPAYQALMQQIGQLQGQKAALEKQVGRLPDTQQELLRLTRDVQVSNDTYTALLNQAQQLDIARAGNVGNVRIVDTAAVDTTQPVKPRKVLVILGGTFVGVFLAVAFIFLRQMLNRGVEDPSEIEKLGLPVYASIPLSDMEKSFNVRDQRSRRTQRQHLLALEAPADLATEALRSLRTSLHFAKLEAKNNVLMVSGSSPNAGKTFVSANLAAVIAQSGQRVLLIDADMRKGGQHKLLGGAAEDGLSELISGQIELPAALRTVAGVEGLHFIARGKIPPNPSELLMHPNFSALLKQMMVQYDMVIIDTPPILAVTDAALIGHHAGTSLLVIRFGLNQSREIALAKQRFEQNNVEIKGAIFNAVQRRAAGYYSYGYYEYKVAK